MLRDTLTVGSDIMPSIALNHMGNALYTSLFGAQITIPTDRISAIQDSGPWIFPALNRIEEVEQMSPPAIPSALVPQAERFIRYCQDHLPQWVRTLAPSKLGSFSLAELLRGSEFYLDLAADPEHCHQLLELCTDCLIETEHYFRGVARQGPDEHISEFGIRGPGPRFGDDSIMNVSGDMIGTFVRPCIDRMARAFGGQAYVHFCSLEDSRSEHVYEAFLDDPYVCAVSSQFGFEYYQHNVDRLEGRLAIESFYGAARNYVTGKFGSFEAWAQDFVPRFKDRSGLILYCEVSSIDEGKRLWQTWNQAHKL